MEKTNKIIIAFALFGAGLIVSTGLIQPVQAKIVEKSVLLKTSSGNIEQYLNNLIDDDELRDKIKKILYGDNVNKYLKEYYNLLKNDEDFLSFVNILEDTYQEKLDNVLLKATTDDQGKEQLESYFENEDLKIQSGLFDFKLEKEKDNNRLKNFNKIKDSFKHIKFLNKIFNSIFQRKDKINNEKMKMSSGDEIIELKNKGEKILEGDFIYISGFLLLLEFFLVDVECELDAKESPVNLYCKLLDQGLYFAVDRDIENQVKKIANDNDIIDDLNKIILLPKPQRSAYVQNIIDTTMNLEDFKKLEKEIEEKYPDLAKEELFSGIRLFFGILCILLGCGLLLVTYYCAVLGYIASIMNPYGLIYFVGAVIALIFAILFFIVGGMLIFF